jgi:putative hemolysin
MEINIVIFDIICEQETEKRIDNQLNGDHPGIGLPNPASVYCEKQGGKVDIRQTPVGEVHISLGFSIYRSRSLLE